MNHLVIFLLTLLCYASSHEIEKRSIFSWGSEAAKEADPATPTGYLPILKVHKYNGIQISPVQGPPVFIPNGPNESNNLDENIQISSDQIQQLDLVNRLANFLPEEDRMQEVDLSAVLPYVDLISEDSIDKIRYAVETTKTKKKSKILKFLAFIKSIKEKKLKPFKLAASVGSKIVHKKKDWLFGTSTTTPEPFTETPAPITYPYNFPYNPYSFQNKQFYNTFTTAAPESSPVPFPSYPHPPQYHSSFQFDTQPKAPSNSEFSQYPQPAVTFPAIQYQHQYLPLPLPIAEPTKNEVTYEYKQPPASTFVSHDNNVIRQFASSPTPSNQYHSQYHFNAPSLPANLPTFPTNQYQQQYTLSQQGAEPAKNDATYDYKQPTATFTANQYTQYTSLPQPSPEPATNEVTYEYKQPPASTFVAQDKNSIRQFVNSNNSDYSSYTISQPTPKVEVSSEQYYSLQSNYVHPFNSIKIPRYPQSNQESNKFFFAPAPASLSNDLTASGSENIEKINDQVKPESQSKIENQSIKLVNDLATSTEISFTKSKTSAAKRTILRTVTPKAPVYEASSKDETIKVDDSKSSPANTV